MRYLRRLSFPCWIAVLCLLISCARPVPAPRQNAGAAQAARLRQQGDAEFAKMHWRGWMSAAGLYREALAKQDGPELRQQLFMAYILLFLRETELSYHNGKESWLLLAEELLPSVPAEPYSSYLAMAREKSRYFTFSRGVFVAPKESELGKKSLPRETATALSHYLYLIYLDILSSQDKGINYGGEEKEFLRRHGDSNLAVFLRSWTPGEMDEKLAAFPDFAEMYKLRGDGRSSGKKYQLALDDYRRALEAMPVLFKASNAMGTLCYSLEEYDQALLHFERTLEIVSLEPRALFGRAICLSELRRYDDSDRALCEMIEKQTFYHGEANYYLAKNSYYRQRRQEARSYLDQAAAYIPNSPEMNMLSGLLYLDQGHPGRATVDFRNVLQQQPEHAEAWYFLGQAALQEKKHRESRRHFQAAIENFRRELAEFDAKLAEMKNGGETDPYQKNHYQKRLRQRGEYAREALARLKPLQQTFRKPPLPGLRELLATLSLAPPEQTI